VRDRSINTTSGTLAVRDHGGDGRDVLLLHGAGHNLEVWRDVVAEIDGRCRAVAADLRGHGQSSVDSSFTIADLVADVHRVCAEMRLERPVLAGHSLGGWVSLAAAAMGGVGSLVSIEGPILAMDKLFGQLGLESDNGTGSHDAIRAAAFKGDEGAWAGRLSRAGPRGSTPRAMAERGRVLRSDGLLHAHPLPDELIAAQRCAWEIDPSALYRRLGISVTIVLGADRPEVQYAERFDAIRQTAADTLAREVPSLTLVRVRGGHHLPVERPREIADVIVDAASTA